MENFFDNQRILQLIGKRKTHFLIIGILAIILSAVFSGPAFIKPKFKSTARVYPINIAKLSNESKTEQMIEILNSNDIKLKMFKAFSLDNVYRIPKDDPNYLTYMFALYNTNVSVSKTEFETAEIKVLDEDPNRASSMCDSIIYYYNQKVTEILRIKQKEMVDILQKELDKKYVELSVLEKQMDSLRVATGIINFNEQVPELTRGYMNALAAGRGNASDTKTIEKLYDNFSKSGSKAVYYENQLRNTLSNIDSLSNRYDFYLSEYEKDITYSQVVEYSFPADKKSYPVRWLIVILSTVSATFLALLVFLVLDYRKS